MHEYTNPRRDLATESALASRIHEIRCQLASPLGAEAFANDLSDPAAALTLMLCQAVTLNQDAALGAAVRETVQMIMAHDAALTVFWRGLADNDYEYADEQLGRLGA